MIGDSLRREREKQQKTIKDIEQGTSIRALYIEAIEKGEYAKLPGEAYTKGFIRNYANFLGMDANEIIKQYKDETGQAEPTQNIETADTSAYTAEKYEKPVSVTHLESGSSFKERVAEARDRSHTGRNLLIGAIALVVIAGGALLFMDDGSDSNQPSQTKAATQTETQNTQKASNATPKHDGVDVKVKFNARCWTEAKVDGKSVYEGTIEKGKTMSWNGKQNVVLRLGNAGAAEISCNGEDIGKAGNVGEVVSRTFTKDGMKADTSDASKSGGQSGKAD